MAEYLKSFLVNREIQILPSNRQEAILNAGRYSILGNFYAIQREYLFRKVTIRETQWLKAPRG